MVFLDWFSTIAKGSLGGFLPGEIGPLAARTVNTELGLERKIA
jgi:hypothetical protein